jgi:hypothetical protein
LPRQSDPSTDSPVTTPADLNPLVNPLLAENMGRWAETYFTAAPENREQAVLDLLHQLEAEKASGAKSPAATRKMEVKAGAASTGREWKVPCPVCGHDNPEAHNFCGMCGAATHEEPGNPPAFEQNRMSDLRHVPPEHFSAQPTEEDWDSEPGSYQPAVRNRNDLSLFQAVGRTVYKETDWGYEPTRSLPYRAFVGILFTLIIGGLGFMAWRGMQNSKGLSASPAPPPSVKESPGPAMPAAQPPATEASNTSVASQKQAEPLPTAPASSAKQQEQGPRQPEPVAEKATLPVANSEKVVQPAPAPSTQLSTGNGSEEFAVAQRYLSGTNGEKRDPAEASKWLWKSIAKHNTQATLPLADLYLKGEGVSKNCDQARVLLDSAARKGVSGAGQRLRNLQAFGCQ